MAQIVLRKYPSETAKVGDVISINNDDVELTGIGYADFTILSIPSVSVDEVNVIARGLEPEQRVYSKSQKIEIEGENSEFIEISKTPKYTLNLAGLTSQDMESLKTMSNLMSKAMLTSKGISCVYHQLDELIV